MYTNCLEIGATYLLQLDGWQNDGGDATVLMEPAATPETGLAGAVLPVQCPVDKDSEVNGAVYPTVTNGGTDFTATWTGPNGFTANTPWISGLAAGAYSVTVTTSCGTVLTNTYNVTQPAPWNIALEVSDAACGDVETGSVDLSVSGATAPYTFVWADAAGLEWTTEDLEDLAPGLYTVEIEDDRGCVRTAAAVVEAGAGLDLDLGPDATICEDESWIVTAPAGYSYMWQDGSVNQFFLVNPFDLAPGTYSIILTLTDAVGCTYLDALILTVHLCSGTEEPGAAKPLKAVPNPVSDRCTLVGSGARAGAAYEILDASGRLMAAGRLGSDRSIEVAGLRAGLYSVRLAGSGSTVRIAVP